MTKCEKCGLYSLVLLDKILLNLTFYLSYFWNILTNDILLDTRSSAFFNYAYLLWDWSRPVSLSPTASVWDRNGGKFGALVLLSHKKLMTAFM